MYLLYKKTGEKKITTISENLPENIDGFDFVEYDDVHPSDLEVYNFFVKDNGIERTLKSENELKTSRLEIQLGNTLFESAIDKMKINELEASQGSLLMEIAMLKMGGIA